MLGISSAAGLIIAVFGGVLVLAALVAVALRSRAAGGRRDIAIPSGLKPGPSDPALETPVLQKLQGWGVVVVAFLAVWVPFNWMREPSTNVKQEEELVQIAEARGAKAVMPFSEENQLGIGCTRCHGPELKGGIIRSGEGFAYPPNLTNICGGNLVNPPHNAIASIDDIYQVLYEGRNAMPSWSIRYKGALDDQQINDIVLHLVKMSSANVPEEDNVCTNPDAVKRATQKAMDSGIVLERP